MSAEIEIIPVTTVTTENWTQPKEEAIEVPGYTEAGVMVTLFNATVASGTTYIALQTAVDNSDDRYVDMVDVATIVSGAVPSVPQPYYVYLKGGGKPPGEIGFARYLKMKVTQEASGSVTFDCRAIMKP